VAMWVRRGVFWLPAFFFCHGANPSDPSGFNVFFREIPVSVSPRNIRKSQKKIWQCVKTLYPCSSHQNSWDLWMFILLKMVCIGIDPYPYFPIKNGDFP